LNIGNIYQVDPGIVRYINELGTPFNSERWSGGKHWHFLQWALIQQEAKIENSTINEGIYMFVLKLVADVVCMPLQGKCPGAKQRKVQIRLLD